MASSGAHTELVLAGLLFSVAVLVTAARVLAVPYPIFLVLGGLAIGAIPGIPNPELEPDLVLLIFLPPLLYSASFFTGLRELRENVRQISMLAIGLVLATALAVALVAHAVIDDMSWPAAFVLGAIVSPTDPVAATAIAGRIGVPRRVVTIVEGEALINDATALVAYKVAVAAVLTGGFTAWKAGAEFLYSGIGGAALRPRRRLGHRPGAASGSNDPPVEITIALFSGYAAYLPAEELGLSGVTAAVAVGLYMGSQTSRLTTPEVRMQGDAVWQIITFLLNSILFLLIGLQLPVILDDLRGADFDTDDLLRLRRRRDGDGDRHAHRLDLRHPVLALHVQARGEPAARRPARSRSSRGWGCAAPSRWPLRSRSRPRPTPASRSPSAP